MNRRPSDLSAYRDVKGYARFVALPSTWTCGSCRREVPDRLDRCWACGAPRRTPSEVYAEAETHPAALGQAIVEFALLAPVLLFTALGFLEAGLLVNAKGSQDRATAVVVEWAARHPSEDWQAVAAVLLPGCATAVVVHPDDPPDVLTIGATCQYEPVATHGLWDGIPISSEASAVTGPEPSPSPSPSPEPSPSP